MKHLDLAPATEQRQAALSWRPRAEGAGAIREFIFVDFVQASDSAPVALLSYFVPEDLDEVLNLGESTWCRLRLRDGNA
jgi:hypothetical protein